MNFQHSLNSGWIKRENNKRLFFKISKTIWTCVCFVPVIIFGILLIEWFVNFIENYSTGGTFWNQLWEFVNTTINNQLFSTIIFIIAFGDFVWFLVDIIRDIKSGRLENWQIWLNIGLLIINLIFIKLIIVNTLFILVKAIWEIILQFVVWGYKIIVLQKQIKKEAH